MADRAGQRGIVRGVDAVVPILREWSSAGDHPRSRSGGRLWPGLPGGGVHAAGICRLPAAPQRARAASLQRSRGGSRQRRYGGVRVGGRVGAPAARACARRRVLRAVQRRAKIRGIPVPAADATRRDAVRERPRCVLRQDGRNNMGCVNYCGRPAVSACTGRVEHGGPVRPGRHPSRVFRRPHQHPRRRGAGDEGSR